MTIRPCQIDDLDLIVPLFDAYRIFYRKKSDIKGARNFLRERLTKEDSIIFVAEEKKDCLVGFTQLYPLFSSTRMKKLWLLNDLYVDPDYRGQGISKLLIEKAKQLVRSTDACGLLLETEKTNTIGNQLYPTTGFELNDSSNYYEWTADK